MFASILVLPIFLQAAAPAPLPPATSAAPSTIGTSINTVEAPPAGTHVVRLSDALEAALKNQPTILEARAQTAAAEGRLTQARSPYYPQVTALASYQRVRGSSLNARSGTGTVTTTPGTGGMTTTPPTGTGTTAGTTGTGTPSAIATTTDAAGIDVFTFGGSVTQIIWDFETTYHRAHAASRLVDAFQLNEKTASQNVIADVRRSYFTARAQKDLVTVANESLANLQRHLDQIQGFVSVGVRPEIDLAQARADVANARLALIDAANAYAIAKAQLRRAMGTADDAEFEVADDELPAVEGEESATDRLVERAIAARPELTSLVKQRESYELTAKAYRGNYWPTLSASAGASETGTALDELGPQWNIGASITWPIFQGGLTHGLVREAEANANLTAAQVDAEKIQIRLDVQQAQLSLRAAKSSQIAAADVVTNAKERLRLAEGRYSSGVGSIIELGDAQLALTTAAAQVVQADFRLSSARADLLAALGQR
jgi:outer membrane protein